MLGASPSRSSSSSPKRRGPPRSASTSRRLHRSPTRWRATSRALTGGGRREGVGIGSGSSYSHLQITSYLEERRHAHRRHPHPRRGGPRRPRRRHPLGRAHRPGPRARLRHRRGRRPACSPTPTTCATAPPRSPSPTGASEQGRIAAVDPDGDLVVLEVDTGDAPALPWADDAGRARRRRVRRRPHRRRRRAHHPRHGERRRAQLPRSAGPPHHRQPRAHRAAGARLLGQPGGRRRAGGCSRSTPPAWPTASTWRSPPTPSSAPASTRWCAASRSTGSCSAWAWRPPTSPASSARRSAWPTARGCSCARSRRTARPSEPACKTGDLITQAGGHDVATVDDLHARPRRAPARRRRSRSTSCAAPRSSTSPSTSTTPSRRRATTA